MSGRKLKLQSIISALFLALVLFLTTTVAAPNAEALNAGSGSKVVSYNGYRYIDSTHIQVWIDKNPGSAFSDTNTAGYNKLQFKIYEGADTSGTELAVTSVTTGSGGNITGISGLSGGGSYMITSAVPFEAGQTYTVVLNNTLKTNSGVNLGHYYSRKDTEFSFTAPTTPANPNVNGTYATVTPKINFRPEQNATKVPQEVVIWFSLNIPMNNTTAAAFSNYTSKISTLVLKKDGTPLTYDYTLNATSEGNIYAPIVTDDRTTVFFPMVGGGSTYSYSLDNNSIYTLDIPAITLINGTVMPAQTLTFTTSTDIVPTKMTGTPTITALGANFNITWTAPSEIRETGNVLVSPAPGSYNVWAGTSPYWNLFKLNSSPVSATEFTTSGLNPSTTYYFRVTGVKGNAETGFSDYVQATTPAAPELTGGDASGLPGAVIEVPVNLTSSGEVAAIQFDLSYDPALLTYQQIIAGSLTSAFSVTANEIAGNKIRVIIYSISENTVAAGSGTVAQLQFKVAATAQEKTCALELSEVTLSDSQGGKILSTNVHNGEFRMLQPPGDMNGDFTVNILDLLWMTHHLGEALTGDSLRADFNEDGFVNILDLLEVKKLY